MASNYKTGASLNLTPFEMQLLSRSPLFRGAGESGIGERRSSRLGAEERSYEKGRNDLSRGGCGHISGRGDARKRVTFRLSTMIWWGNRSIS